MKYFKGLFEGGLVETICRGYVGFYIIVAAPALIVLCGVGVYKTWP